MEVNFNIAWKEGGDGKYERFAGRKEARHVGIAVKYIDSMPGLQRPFINLKTLHWKIIVYMREALTDAACSL